MKKLIALIMALALVAAIAIVPVSAAPGDSVKVTLRIEGDSALLYNSSVTLTAGETALTAADFIVAADEGSESLEVTGAAEGYITAVNGIAGAKYGGWDGWMYLVNGVSPSVGVNEYEINNGDEIVLYYGDPFGVGMQFPELDLSAVKTGVIKVISKDTVYDDNYNASVVVNPVAGATVTIDGKAYTTDDEGVINVDLAPGDHSVAIERTAANGCPTVLRFAPGTTFNVPAAGHVQTGDNGVLIYVILGVIALAACAAAIAVGKRGNAKA